MTGRTVTIVQDFISVMMELHKGLFSLATRLTTANQTTKLWYMELAFSQTSSFFLNPGLDSGPEPVWTKTSCMFSACRLGKELRVLLHWKLSTDDISMFEKTGYVLLSSK